MILREIKTDINSEVPILDLEIKNNISNESGQWDYQKGDIICCGIFYGDKVTILFREKKDNINSYKAKLREILDKLPTCYAFNFSFEKGVLQGFLGKSYWIEEIKAWKGKGWSKQKFFEELVRLGKINLTDVPKDPLENDSEEVINKYAENDYESVINHNVADVVKQYYIFKFKHFLLKKYEKNINKEGWWQE